MQTKRRLSMVLCCMLLVSMISLPASAAEIQATTQEISFDDFISPCATGSFNWTIPAKTKAQGDIVFPLAAGETVTIKASYSPFSASVDWKPWEDSSGHAYASYCADLPDSSGLILDASIDFWVGDDSCYITVNDELAKG